MSRLYDIINVLLLLVCVCFLRITAHNQTIDTHNHTAGIHNHTTNIHNYTTNIHNYTTNTHNYTTNTHNYTTTHNHTTNTHNHTPTTHDNTPATHAHTPATHAHTPTTYAHKPITHAHTPATHDHTPATHAYTATSLEGMGDINTEENHTTGSRNMGNETNIVSARHATQKSKKSRLVGKVNKDNQWNPVRPSVLDYIAEIFGDPRQDVSDFDYNELRTGSSNPSRFNSKFLNISTSEPKKVAESRVGSFSARKQDTTLADQESLLLSSGVVTWASVLDPGPTITKRQYPELQTWETVVDEGPTVSIIPYQDFMTWSNLLDIDAGNGATDGPSEDTETSQVPPGYVDQGESDLVAIGSKRPPYKEPYVLPDSNELRNPNTTGSNNNKSSDNSTTTVVNSNPPWFVPNDGLYIITTTRRPFTIPTRTKRPPNRRATIHPYIFSSILKPPFFRPNTLAPFNQRTTTTTTRPSLTQAITSTPEPKEQGTQGPEGAAGIDEVQVGNIDTLLGQSGSVQGTSQLTKVDNTGLPPGGHSEKIRVPIDRYFETTPSTVSISSSPSTYSHPFSPSSSYFSNPTSFHPTYSSTYPSSSPPFLPTPLSPSTFPPSSDTWYSPSHPLHLDTTTQRPLPPLVEDTLTSLSLPSSFVYESTPTPYSSPSTLLYYAASPYVSSSTSTTTSSSILGSYIRPSSNDAITKKTTPSPPRLPWAVVGQGLFVKHTTRRPVPHTPSQSDSPSLSYTHTHSPTHLLDHSQTRPNPQTHLLDHSQTHLLDHSQTRPNPQTHLLDHSQTRPNPQTHLLDHSQTRPSPHTPTDPQSHPVHLKSQIPLTDGLHSNSHKHSHNLTLTQLHALQNSVNNGISTPSRFTATPTPVATPSFTPSSPSPSTPALDTTQQTLHQEVNQNTHHLDLDTQSSPTLTTPFPWSDTLINIGNTQQPPITPPPSTPRLSKPQAHHPFPDLGNDLDSFMGLLLGFPKDEYYTWTTDTDVRTTSVTSEATTNNSLLLETVFDKHSTDSDIKHPDKLTTTPASNTILLRGTSTTVISSQNDDNVDYEPSYVNVLTKDNLILGSKIDHTIPDVNPLSQVIYVTQKLPQRPFVSNDEADSVFNSDTQEDKINQQLPSLTQSSTTTTTPSVTKATTQTSTNSWSLKEWFNSVITQQSIPQVPPPALITTPVFSQAWWDVLSASKITPTQASSSLASSSSSSLIHTPDVASSLNVSSSKPGTFSPTVTPSLSNFPTPTPPVAISSTSVVPVFPLSDDDHPSNHLIPSSSITHNVYSAVPSLTVRPSSESHSPSFITTPKTGVISSNNHESHSSTTRPHSGLSSPGPFPHFLDSYVYPVKPPPINSSLLDFPTPPTSPLPGSVSLLSSHPHFPLRASNSPHYPHLPLVPPSSASSVHNIYPPRPSLVPLRPGSPSLTPSLDESFTSSGKPSVDTKFKPANSGQSWPGKVPITGSSHLGIHQYLQPFPSRHSTFPAVTTTGTRSSNITSHNTHSKVEGVSDISVNTEGFTPKPIQETSQNKKHHPLFLQQPDSLSASPDDHNSSPGTSVSSHTQETIPNFISTNISINKPPAGSLNNDKFSLNSDKEQLNLLPTKVNSEVQRLQAILIGAAQKALPHNTSDEEILMYLLKMMGNDEEISKLPSVVQSHKEDLNKKIQLENGNKEDVKVPVLGQAQKTTRHQAGINITPSHTWLKSGLLKSSILAYSDARSSFTPLIVTRTIPTTFTKTVIVTTVSRAQSRPTSFTTLVEKAITRSQLIPSPLKPAYSYTSTTTESLSLHSSQTRPSPITDIWPKVQTARPDLVPSNQHNVQPMPPSYYGITSSYDEVLELLPFPVHPHPTFRPRTPQLPPNPTNTWPYHHRFSQNQGENNILLSESFGSSSTSFNFGAPGQVWGASSRYPFASPHIGALTSANQQIVPFIENYKPDDQGTIRTTLLSSAFFPHISDNTGTTVTTPTITISTSTEVYSPSTTFPLPSYHQATLVPQEGLNSAHLKQKQLSQVIQRMLQRHISGDTLTSGYSSTQLGPLETLADNIAEVLLANPSGLTSLGLQDLDDNGSKKGFAALEQVLGTLLPQNGTRVEVNPNTSILQQVLHQLTGSPHLTQPYTTPDLSTRNHPVTLSSNPLYTWSSVSSLQPLLSPRPPRFPPPLPLPLPSTWERKRPSGISRVPQPVFLSHDASDVKAASQAQSDAFSASLTTSVQTTTNAPTSLAVTTTTITIHATSTTVLPALTTTITNLTPTRSYTTYSTLLFYPTSHVIASDGILSVSTVLLSLTTTSSVYPRVTQKDSQPSSNPGEKSSFVDDVSVTSGSPISLFSSFAPLPATVTVSVLPSNDPLVEPQYNSYTASNTASSATFTLPLIYSSFSTAISYLSQQTGFPNNKPRPLGRPTLPFSSHVPLPATVTVSVFPSNDLLVGSQYTTPGVANIASSTTFTLPLTHSLLSATYPELPQFENIQNNRPGEVPSLARPLSIASSYPLLPFASYVPLPATVTVPLFSPNGPQYTTTQEGFSTGPSTSSTASPSRPTFPAVYPWLSPLDNQPGNNKPWEKSSVIGPLSVTRGSSISQFSSFVPLPATVTVSVLSSYKPLVEPQYNTYATYNTASSTTFPLPLIHSSFSASYPELSELESIRNNNPVQESSFPGPLSTANVRPLTPFTSYAPLPATVTVSLLSAYNPLLESQYTVTSLRTASTPSLQSEIYHTQSVFYPTTLPLPTLSQLPHNFLANGNSTPSSDVQSNTPVSDIQSSTPTSDIQYFTPSSAHTVKDLSYQVLQLQRLVLELFQGKYDNLNSSVSLFPSVWEVKDRPSYVGSTTSSYTTTTIPIIASETHHFSYPTAVSFPDGPALSINTFPVGSKTAHPSSTTITITATILPTTDLPVWNSGAISQSISPTITTLTTVVPSTTTTTRIQENSNVTSFKPPVDEDLKPSVIGEKLTNLVDQMNKVTLSLGVNAPTTTTPDLPTEPKNVTRVALELLEEAIGILRERYGFLSEISEVERMQEILNTLLQTAIQPQDSGTHDTKIQDEQNSKDPNQVQLSQDFNRTQGYDGLKTSNNSQQSQLSSVFTTPTPWTTAQQFFVIHPSALPSTQSSSSFHPPSHGPYDLFPLLKPVSKPGGINSESLTNTPLTQTPDPYNYPYTTPNHPHDNYHGQKYHGHTHSSLDSHLSHPTLSQPSPDSRPITTNPISSLLISSSTSFVTPRPPLDSFLSSPSPAQHNFALAHPSALSLPSHKPYLERPHTSLTLSETQGHFPYQNKYPAFLGHTYHPITHTQDSDTLVGGGGGGYQSSAKPGYVDFGVPGYESGYPVPQEDAIVAADFIKHKDPESSEDSTGPEDLPSTGVSRCGEVGRAKITNFINPSYPYPDRGASTCVFRLLLTDPTVCQ
ncbi:hypothetical protein Pcinc_025221, partial [Petrolisthes cinctipes]